MSWLRGREAYEQEELARLAPCAVKSAESLGRLQAEDEHPYRTAFQRDRDRVVHCRAFRRLEYKTQVFVHHEGDHYRNRLTHTLEGTQIARTVARALRLNEDLAEAVALAHDMGHTPFGHAGERVLSELMGSEGGFDHNRQTLRVVDLLEERYPGFRGLNLTNETREGILKHGCHWPHPVAVPESRRQRSLEAQVADVADEIAYTNHDLDDGLHSGILDLEMLDDSTLWRDARERALERVSASDEPLLRTQTIIALINALVTDVIEATAKRLALLEPGSVEAVRETEELLLGFSQETQEAKIRLKRFLRENFYHHPRVRGATDQAERIVSDLFHAYRRDTSLLPERARERFDQDGELRAIVDHIAGMTDRYAMEVHGELIGGKSMSLAQALEQAASALGADADAIRPANGDPTQLLELLDSEAALRVLTWLLTHEVEAGEELAVSWSDEEKGLGPLGALDEAALPKVGRKVLRRLRHRLRSRGVELESGAGPAPVVARLPDIRDHIDLAYVADLDPRGAQLVYLVEGKSSGGAHLFEIVVDELRGVVGFEVYSAGRSKLRQFTRELERSGSLSAVAADPAAARALVVRIAEEHPSDRPLPNSFREWRGRFAKAAGDARTPGQLAREALGSAGAPPENALEGLAEALRQGDLAPWPGEAEAMEAVGKQLGEALGDLGEASEEERASARAAAVAVAARELFDEGFARKTAARFEESAHAAWKQGRQEDALARLAAADAFRAEAAGDNPVARALVEAYFSSLVAP